MATQGSHRQKAPRVDAKVEQPDLAALIVRSARRIYWMRKLAAEPSAEERNVESEQAAEKGENDKHNQDRGRAAAEQVAEQIGARISGVLTERDRDTAHHRHQRQTTYEFTHKKSPNLRAWIPDPPRRQEYTGHPIAWYPKWPALIASRALREFPPGPKARRTRPPLAEGG